MSTDELGRAGGAHRDQRKVFRLMFDVLATDRQADALVVVIGEALCAASELHDGACRVAWSASRESESDVGEEGAGLTEADVADIREDLAPVEVWSTTDVDCSLGLSPE